MRRALVAGLFCLGAFGLGAAPAAAEPAPNVLICHGTASATNPYVLIEVNANSFKDGHFDDGPENKSHGVNNSPDKLAPAGATNADDCVNDEPPEHE